MKDDSDGARAVQRALYDEWFETVWRMVGLLGVPGNDRSDVCQIVWMDALEGLPEIPPEARKAWLYGITRRKVNEYLRQTYRRKRLHEPQVLSIVLGDRSLAPDPEKSVMLREQARVLYAALDRMDPALREIFVAHELEGIPIADIAREQGQPRSTVDTHFRRAKTQFEAAVSDLLGRDHDRPALSSLLPWAFVAEQVDPAPFSIRESIWARVQAPDAPPPGPGPSVPPPKLPRLSLLRSPLSSFLGGALTGAVVTASTGAATGATMGACTHTPDPIVIYTPTTASPPPVASFAAIPVPRATASALSMPAPVESASAAPVVSAAPVRAAPVIRARPKASGSDRLKSEQDLMESVTRAFDRNDPAEGIKGLIEHAQRFPHGKLAAERDRMLHDLARASQPSGNGVNKHP